MLAKTEKSQVKEPFYSKKPATSTATTTTAASTIEPSSVNPTGWRRPSISTASPLSTASSAASFPQRKVPSLLPELSVLEASLSAVPEPFADFPRLPGMKAAPPVQKTLSLINDEASWLDGDEIDYSQQLFGDSEKIFEQLKVEELKESVVAFEKEKSIAVDLRKAHSVQYSQQKPYQSDHLNRFPNMNPTKSHAENWREASRFVPEKESPKKIVILKRPIVPETPEIVKPIKVQSLADPVEKSNSMPSEAKPVRSFKTAKTLQKEAKAVEEPKEKMTEEIVKEFAKVSVDESKVNVIVTETKANTSTKPSAKPSKPAEPVKKIVYSCQTKTKTVIEK